MTSLNTTDLYKRNFDQINEKLLHSQKRRLVNKNFDEDLRVEINQKENSLNQNNHKMTELYVKTLLQVLSPLKEKNLNYFFKQLTASNAHFIYCSLHSSLANQSDLQKIIDSALSTFSELQKHQFYSTIDYMNERKEI